MAKLGFAMLALLMTCVACKQVPNGTLDPPVGRYQLVQVRYVVGMVSQDTVLRVDTAAGKTRRYDVGENAEGFWNRGYWTPIEDSKPLTQ